MAYKTEFGDAVRAALAGRPYRQIAARTKGVDLSPSYIADMVQGRVPRREVVVAFADACQLDEPATNALLLAGGLAPLEPEEESGFEIFTRGAAELARRYGRPVPVSFSGGEENLTPEQARAHLAELEKQLEEGLI